jgi:hypothetical protein
MKKMRETIIKKKIRYVLYLFIVISIIGLALFNQQPQQKHNNNNILHNFNTENPIIKPSNGLDPINSTNIYLNDTEIITLFDTVRIDLNTTQYSGVNYTEIQFIFADGTSFTDRMFPSVGTNYTYNFTAPYNIPTGLQKIYFQIYNEVDVILNANETDTTFLVKSNYYNAAFAKEQVYLEDILSVSLSIQNTTEHNFTYNVAIVDNIDEPQTNLYIPSPADNIDWFNVTVEESIFPDLNRFYYIKVNLTEQTSSKVNATYFPFEVLNQNPTIIESTISYSATEIFRSATNNCRVSLNITDFEDHPANLTVTLTLSDLFGGNELQYTLSQSGFNFSTAFYVPFNYPIGTYKATITAEDLNNGVSSYVTDIEVKNNPPQFNLYMINGKLPSQPISVDYGDNIVFGFDITDKDNDIEYITVTLMNEDNQFFTVSTVNKFLSINSAELEPGTWYISISATDSEGTTINLSSDYGLAPQQIQIEANTLENLMPWITLAIGIIAGLLIGIVIAYKLLKRKRFREPSSGEEKKASKEKPEKKRKKAEGSRDKETEKKEEEKAKEKKPKRRIKRRL